MQKEKLTKEQIEEFVIRNGACSLSTDGEGIRLWNGGLFEDMNDNYTTLWTGDLDDVIRYLKRLKYFLNKHGINTRRDIESIYIDNENK